MSVYSLDSLEALQIREEGNGESSMSGTSSQIEVMRNVDSLESVSFGSTDLREIPGGAPDEDHLVIEKREAAETSNPLIASKLSQAGPTRVPKGLKSLDHDESSSISKDAPISPEPSSSKRFSQRSNFTLKNDKKLGDILAPKIVQVKSKPKTYLERYREKLGVPAKIEIRSPEGSTLSMFGDTCYEPMTDVDSRPPTTTPRDDESELSFYRRLINNETRSTRSWHADNRGKSKANLRSVSDYGLTMNHIEERLSYRPYSMRDYKCLTVPCPDRSLGPDRVDIREKLEKLMRRTHYGELASSRNRQNVAKRQERRKCKRTSVQKHAEEFSLSKDSVPGEIAESKKFGATLRCCSKVENPASPPSTLPLRIKKKTTKNKMLIVAKSLANYPAKNSTKSDSIATALTSPKSLEETLRCSCSSADFSLQDLQRRHQNEKRVIDLIVNRTLLR